MGWLWMCLGVRDKSARRIGGRVSSDTYLAPQYDPTKTPRIEDYLQPRRTGYDALVSGHPSGCPTSKPGEKDLAAGHKGPLQYRRCVSESVKGEYGPYWGYAEDLPVEEFVSIEFPRVTPSTRKSFSELLIETDTLDKGPLALAAIAAAAERAARSARLQKEGSSSASGIQIKGVNEGSQIVTLKAARSNGSEATEGGAGGSKVLTEARYAQPPQSPHSSLSKEHLEASNAVVAAFRESRRQSSQLSERSSTQQHSAANNPSYISNVFRSSRKRSLPFRSRSFQRPLSPVLEVLSLDEELRSRRKSDVALPTTAHGEPSKPSSSTPHDSPLTEDWDDYVHVERVQATPPSDATSSTHGRVSESSSESSEGVLQDNATSDDATPDVATASTVRQTPSGDSAADREDDTLLRTPVRDPLVTPEVFISPKTATSELNFTRVMDMDPVERPIFGSLADHWEAAWATKRPTWDGKGIPNSTNKYREDQKVMWHAAPFEERLAQALASQQDSVPQRRNSFNGPTSRLAATRNDRSLQAH